MSLTEKIDFLNYLSGLREFQDFMNLGLADESEVKKIAHLMSLLTRSCAEGRLLEVMAYPYFLSALIREFTSFTHFCTFHWEKERILPTSDFDRIHGIEGNELIFNPTMYELERERIPFPDRSLDVVVFSDVLQHLRENPSLVLREMHRILKPGGLLLLSTPNALRFGNLLKLFRSENAYDPYSGMGMWGRSYREYTAQEITMLLESLNFQVLKMETMDVTPLDHVSWKTMRALKELVGLLFPPEGGRDFQEYVFVTAEARGPEKFCFPDALFLKLRPDDTAVRSMAGGLMDEFTENRIPPELIAHYAWTLDFVEAGMNDLYQLGSGWHELEGEIHPFRWTSGEAEVFLRNSDPKRLLELELMMTKVHDEIYRPRIFEQGHEVMLPESLNKMNRDGQWKKIGFILPESSSTLRRISIRAEKTFVPSEISPGSSDARSLGFAVHRIALHPGNKLIMGENDELLLGEGWGPLQFGPPFVRRMKKEASLTLFPLGFERQLQIEYIADQVMSAALILQISPGAAEVRLTVDLRKGSNTFSIPLPERLSGETPVMVKLADTREERSPGGSGGDENVPGQGVGISRIELR